MADEFLTDADPGATGRSQASSLNRVVSNDRSQAGSDGGWTIVRSGLVGLVLLLLALAPTACSWQLPTATPPITAQLVVKDVTPAPNAYTGNLDTSCPPGTVVTGGGLLTDSANFVLYVSAPISTTAWRINFHDNSGQAPIVAYHVQLICLTLAQGESAQLATQDLLVLPGAYTGPKNTACPAGTSLAGGGIDTTSAADQLYVNAPINTTTWQVSFHDANPGNGLTGTPNEYHVNLVCLKLVAPAATQLSVRQLLAGPLAYTGNIDTACPAATLLTDGGIDTDAATTKFYQTTPLTTTTWRSNLHNTDSNNSIAYEAHLLCVTTKPGLVSTAVLQLPTAVPTAVPTQKPTPVGTHFVPVVGWQVTPTAFQQSCTGPSDPLPARTLTLDNGGSNVAVGYQVVNIGTSQNGHEPWATASPAAGTVDAGKQARLTLTPAGDLCTQLWSAGITAPVNYTLGVQLTSGGSGATTVTDSVTPFKLT
jgi:hypothetical protein